MRNNEQAAKCGVQKGKKEKEGIKLRGNVKKEKRETKEVARVERKKQKKKKENSREKGRTRKKRLLVEKWMKISKTAGRGRENSSSVARL